MMQKAGVLKRNARAREHHGAARTISSFSARRHTLCGWRALVVVDVAQLAHKPMPTRSPAGDHPITATFKARVEALQAEPTKVEASAAGHRADFERELADRLMTELWRRRPTPLSSKEAAARLDGELAALRLPPWWRRMVG